MKSCCIDVPLSWTWIESVRSTVAAQLADHDEDLREASVMVASELAENVVKYGEPRPGTDSGQIQLSVDDRCVRILSVNGVQAQQRVERLGEIFERLRATPDPLQLYMQRLQELLANPNQVETQTGFLRIVCEGQFALSHDYVGGVLTIAAERKL